MFRNRRYRQIESCPDNNQNVPLTHFYSRLQISLRWTAQIDDEPTIFFSQNPLIDFPTHKKGKHEIIKETCYSHSLAQRAMQITFACRFVCKQTILTKESGSHTSVCYVPGMEIDSKRQQMFSSAPSARITFNLPCFHTSLLCTWVHGSWTVFSALFAFSLHLKHAWMNEVTSCLTFYFEYIVLPFLLPRDWLTFRVCLDGVVFTIGFLWLLIVPQVSFHSTAWGYRIEITFDFSFSTVHTCCEKIDWFSCRFHPSCRNKLLTSGEKTISKKSITKI